MRRLHRAPRWPADPLLHHADLRGRQRQGRHALRPRHAREAAPAADRLCGGAGHAVRLLHQRLDHDRGRVPARQEEPDRERDQAGARRAQVSLRNPHEHPARGQARSHDDGLREAVMTKMDKPTHFSRRAVLKAGGALVVSIGAPIALDTVLGIQSAYAQATRPPLVPDQLSSYIAINTDGSVSAFFGKMDMGQGLYVSIAQMVAEELDVPFKAVTVFMADTRTSVNRGGAS